MATSLSFVQAYLKQQEDAQGRLKERVAVLEESMQVQAGRVAQAEIQLSETDGKIQSSILDQLDEIPRIKQNLQKVGSSLVSLHDQLQLVKNSKLSPESGNIHLGGRFGNWNGPQAWSHVDSSRGLGSRNASLNNDKGQQSTATPSRPAFPKVEAIQVEIPTIQTSTAAETHTETQQPNTDEKAMVMSSNAHQGNKRIPGPPAVGSVKQGDKGMDLGTTVPNAMGVSLPRLLECSHSQKQRTRCCKGLILF